MFSDFASAEQACVRMGADPEIVARYRAAVEEVCRAAQAGDAATYWQALAVADQARAQMRLSLQAAAKGGVRS